MGRKLDWEKNSRDKRNHEARAQEREQERHARDLNRTYRPAWKNKSGGFTLWIDKKPLKQHQQEQLQAMKEEFERKKRLRDDPDAF